PSFNGSALYLLGETYDELDGSQFAHLRGHLGGVPPKVDLAQEARLAGLLANASRTHMLDAAHDLSEGGLAGALADMVLQAGVGVRVNLEYVTERDNIDAFTALFSESQARAIVAVPLSEDVRFRGIAESRRYAALRIGVVDADSDSLEIQDLFSASIAELHEGWASALPKRFGNQRSKCLGLRLVWCPIQPQPCLTLACLILARRSNGFWFLLLGRWWSLDELQPHRRRNNAKHKHQPKHRHRFSTGDHTPGNGQSSTGSGPHRISGAHGDGLGRIAKTNHAHNEFDQKYDGRNHPGQFIIGSQRGGPNRFQHSAE